MVHASPTRSRPVLLFDVMDTCVADPFHAMPAHFGLDSMTEFLQSKHPTAWIEFEEGRINEAQLCDKFFQDSRAVDVDALKAMLRVHYEFLPGMESLLARLARAGFEAHAFSNYPAWHELIEEKLTLSQHLPWTFLSCTGPMQGVRKPTPEAYARVVAHLGIPAADLLFIDDRRVNTQAAEAFGIPSILFTGAAELELQFRQRGLEF